MANLNANRNLPPDSTAWGRAVESRLSSMEKSINVLHTKTTNTAKGLSSLIDRVGDIQINAGHSYGYSWNVNNSKLSGDTVYQDYYGETHLSIPVRTRTGRVFVSGLAEFSISGLTVGSSVGVMPYLIPKGQNKEEMDWGDYVNHPLTRTIMNVDKSDYIMYAPISGLFEATEGEWESGAVVMAIDSSSGILFLENIRLMALSV